MCLLATLVGLLTPFSAGCSPCRKCGHFCPLHHHCADIPRGAIPAPVGSYAGEWQCAQASRAEAGKFTIYTADWQGSSAQLSPFGKKRLGWMAEHLHETPFPVLIEQSESPQVDGQRQIAVLEFLASKGAEVSPDTVVVGYPQDYGLYGQEAGAVAHGTVQRDSGGTLQASPFTGFRGGFRGGLSGGVSPY
jgi:hypothetical protein